MDARERLEQLVGASGMTQAELARRLGEPAQWVNNRLRGESAIKADELPRLAAALRVPPSAFFQESGMADVIFAIVLRLLADMPPGYRAELWNLATREEKRLHPERFQGPGRDMESLRNSIAANVARQLTEAWTGLPEEEQEFLTGIIEGRARVREQE